MNKFCLMLIFVIAAFITPIVIGYYFFNGKKKTIALYTFVLWFIFLGIPLIIFLVNYNKIFKKKTFNYLFAMSIVCWSLEIVLALSEICHP